MPKGDGFRPAIDDADVITFVLADQKTCKHFRLRDDGKLEKTSVATAKGRAHGVRVHDAKGLVSLLKEATGDDSTVLIPGHFVGNDSEQPFNLVYENELANLLGRKKGDAELGGVHTVNGRRVAARLKLGIEPCAWLLLDFDSPEGMPPEFAALDIAGRLALLEKVVPGISTCERVECRSSSARIVPPANHPASADWIGRASHAWVRVSDPDQVEEALRPHIRVEAALHGLDFLSPRHCRESGAVIAHAHLTLLDLSVWTRGRIVFCSAPTISPGLKSEGWTVADADVRIVNPGGGVLDISRITKPKAARLNAYRKKTGENLEIGRRGGFSVVERGALKLDTPIESRHAPDVKTLGDAVEWLKRQTGEDRKLRCEAPFRDSVSDAAFIRLDEQGEPFLHDSGTNTTYRIAVEFPPLDAETLAALDAAAERAWADSGQARPSSTSGGGGAGGGGGVGNGPAGAGQTGAQPNGVIIELPRNMEATAEKAFAALAAQGEVYRRGRLLVVPDASVVLDTRRGKQQHAAIVTLGSANLMRFLDGAAPFLKFNKNGMLVPAYPSARLCKVLLEYVANRPTCLPVLNGVMRGPFLRRDGTVCTDPAYDAASGIFVHPGETIFPAMPDLTPANARKVAEQALGRLLCPLREYQFDTSVRDANGAWKLADDVCRAVAVSMFLTAVTVHATRTRPAYLADAPVFGSGKTLLTELPALMMLGIDPPLISLADERGGDERDKQLDSALLRGTGCIVFDNARGDLARFGKLVMLLTGATVAVRLFHTQTILDVDNNFLITVSGNNAITNDDMARRFLRARIDTGLERPDRKHFSFDPRDEVVRDRARMVIDALTIVRAYQVAGAPEQNGEPNGSFETWTRLVRDPLMWLGLPDIVTSNDAAQADDPAVAELRAVLTAWQASGLTGDYTAEELNDATAGVTHPDLREALRAVATERGSMFAISAKRLGWWFKRVVGRRVGGLCIARRLLDGRHRYRLDQQK